MFAFDPDTGKLWFGLNGVWQGDPVAGSGERFSGIVGTQYPVVSVYGGGKVTLTFDPAQFFYTFPAGYGASEVLQ